MVININHYRHREAAAGTSSIWVDNFSHTWKVSLPDITSSTYTDANWTGVCVRKYVGPPLDMLARLDHGQEIIPAMPSKDEFFANISHFVSQLNELDQREFIDDALVTEFKIDTVPMKLRVSEDHRFRQLLREANTDMSTFLPVDLLKYNIGSNAGLVQFWKSYYEEHIERKPIKKYKTVMSDVNIFFRSLKVHFCKLGLY